MCGLPLKSGAQGKFSLRADFPCAPLFLSHLYAAAPVCLPFSADRAVKMVQTAQKLPFYKIKLNLG